MSHADQGNKRLAAEPLVGREDAPLKALAHIDPERLAQMLDAEGIASIEGCFSSDDIATAESQVRAIVSHRQNEYVACVGSDGFAGMMLAQLATSPAFLALCAAIYRARHQKGHDTSIKQVLRCLSGSTGVAESNYFHFDSYAITVIAPIIMPRTGPPGDLVFFPVFREKTVHYSVNVAQKALLGLRPTQALLRWACNQGYASRVRLEPGTLYFLDGERALHANEPCDPSAIRATLVIHFAEAQYSHWLSRNRRGGRQKAATVPAEAVKGAEFAQE